MSDRRRPAAAGEAPLRRAHRSLLVLIVVMILMAGAVTATISAPPSPLTGVGFALSSITLAVAFLLAARVTLAIDAARRSTRPRVSFADAFPVLTRRLRGRPKG